MTASTLNLDAAPPWAVRLAGGPAASDSIVTGTPLRVRRAAAATLLSGSVRDARRLPPAALGEAVADLYRAVGRQVAGEGRHAVRVWNFIPSPNEVVAPGLDRYMAFNTGRHRAYSDPDGPMARLGASMPTASGVGTSRDDLTIHCLATPQPGRPVEHRRQIPAYRYSSRYGPHPPCFARATLITTAAGDVDLLVAGTASVRGEDSVHMGDLPGQVDETLANLASVVRAGTSAAGLSDLDDEAALSCFVELRIYLPDPGLASAVTRLLDTRFPAVREFEFVQADLCRAELMVEIEGLAQLTPRRSSRRGQP